MLKGLDTSAIKFVQALSPTAVTSLACSNPIDFSNFTAGTVILNAGSTAAVTVSLYVLRSATSNGTFQGTGASMAAAVLGKTHVRSFGANSSAVWYQIYRTHVGAGSPVCSITVLCQGAREMPIDQDSNTTSYSVIP